MEVVTRQTAPTEHTLVPATTIPCGQCNVPLVLEASSQTLVPEPGHLARVPVASIHSPRKDIRRLLAFAAIVVSQEVHLIITGLHSLLTSEGQALGGP